MKNGGVLRAFIVAGMVLLLQFTSSSLRAQVASGTIVGTTRDSLERRIAEHEAGTFGGYTA